MNIKPKPPGCEGCPLQHKGQGFVPDQLPAEPEYLLIGEAPGKNEIIDGKPFVGKAGFVLKQWLVRAVPSIRIAMEKDRVGLCNTLRCLPPEIQKRPYPRGEERVLSEAQCRQYDRVPETVHTVVLFGEAPQRVHFAQELEEEDQSDKRLRRDLKGVMGRIGREYTKDGKRYVFAPHPAYILRQPAYVAHGQSSLRIAANTEKVVEVEYVGWAEALASCHA